MKTGGIALLKKNLTLGLLTRLFSLLLTYVSIPIVLNYLGAESYGFWIILFTGISWIYNFDMGVGLGLKNQLTEAIIEKNDTKCSEIISTAYAIIIFITLIMLIISLLLLNYLDIKKILAINFLSKEYINNIILITISFAYLNFIIGLYKQLFQSINLSGAVGISSVLIQLAIIISIIIASKLTESSLYITTIIYGLANFTFGSIYTFFFFYKRKRIKLNISYFRKSLIKPIMSISTKFFLIQLSMLVILTSDNIILGHYLGTESVTNYSVLMKLYQTFLIISIIIITPYWTVFTEEYKKNNQRWIKNTIKKFNYLSIILALALFTLFFFAQDIINLWIGNDIHYGKETFILFSIFIFIRVYIDIYTVFLNSISKIKMQMYLYCFGAIINIPLSIYLIKQTNLGINSVIISTILCLLPLFFIMPIQYFIEIRKMNNE